VDIMTEFALPPLSVGWDARWVQVPLSGNIDEWARTAAEKYVADHGGSKRQVRGLLEGAGEIARRAGDAAVTLILLPEAAKGIRALVRFCPVDLSGLPEGDDGWSVLLGQLAADSPWEDADITELTTKAGPCRRIIAKYVMGEGEIRGIGENVSYVWLFPQHGAGLWMMTSFVNLAESGLWRSALDELAAAVELEQVS
jgi:hypothetical protein